MSSETKRKFSIKRLLQLFAGFTSLGVAYTVWFWYDQLYPSPVETYHQVWEDIREYAFAPEELKRWGDWEHKFDSELKTQDDAYHSARIMLHSLHDKYSALLDSDEVNHQKEAESGTYTGFGMGFGVDADRHPDREGIEHPRPKEDKDGHPMIDSIFPESPAARAGLAKGDVVTAINGSPTTGRSFDELATLIKKDKTVPAEIEFQRNGKANKLSIKREAVIIPVTSSRMLSPTVGYLKISNFVDNNLCAHIEKSMHGIARAKFLVIDMRNNSGGKTDLCFSALSQFMKEGPLTTIKARIKGAGYQVITFELLPEKIVMATVSVSSETHQKQVQVRDMRRELQLWKNSKIAILTNKHTASCGEMFTAALQENDLAKVFGTKTLGKGIAQIQIPVPYGGLLHLTSARYYTPKQHWLGDGGNSVANGIKPDFEVDDSEDLSLKAALAWLEKQI